MTARATAKPGIMGRTALDQQHLDTVLIIVIGVLLCGGLVMLTSASISLAERNTGNPFFYLQRQLVAVAIGLTGAAVMMRIPTQVWERFGIVLVCLAIGLLMAVFVPGLGHTVNGSTRWLSIAGINIMQVSEPVRLLMLMYISGYAVRHRQELRERFIGFAKPMLLVAGTCVLLLLQPDFGASVIMLMISLSVLFIAGARLRDFFACGVVVGGLGSAVCPESVLQPVRASDSATTAPIKARLAANIRDPSVRPIPQ